MFETLTVRADNMKKAAAKGFINATDAADYLTRKGLPFRDAYKASGTLVGYCIANNKTLEELTLDEYKAVCPMFENDVYDAIDLHNCVSRRDIPGGPGLTSVGVQLETLDKFIKEKTI